MGIFNIFGKKDAASDITKNVPFRISTELVPYRLYAKKNSSASLIVKVKNMTNEILLTSVVLELPSQLGFDSVGMSKQREMRVGEIPPQEEKEVKFEIFGTGRSDAGEYTVTLTSIAHYRDYGHVLNAVKKRATVNVV